MIAARKSLLFDWLLRRWLGFLVRRRFHNVYLLGAENIERLDPAAPVVGCVNHTNWWDGFILHVLTSRRLKRDAYLAMDEANLGRYRFLRWLGVFGLDLSKPRSAVAGLRYAMRLLAASARKPRLVWIFVQGKLVRPLEPIRAKPGASFLAARSGAQLLPITLRYEWLMESRPSIFVNIGRAMRSDATPEAIGETLDGLFRETEAVLEPAHHVGCETLFPVRMSMNKRWEYVKSWFARRREGFDTENH